MSTTMRNPADSAATMGQGSWQSDAYPAAYGRACASCSQSKCKCIYPRAGGRCQRCQRLNKECRPSVGNRRQSSRKTNASKTARLEEKLEDLVSLLRDRTQPTVASSVPIHPTAPTITEQPEQRREFSNHPALPSGSLDAGSVSNAGVTPHHGPPPNPPVWTPETSISEPSSSYPSAAASSSSLSQWTSNFDLTPLQAEERLTIFHTQMLPYLPLMYLPAGTTAQLLRRDRPFLWLCIMTVSSRMGKQQRALCDRIKHVISQQMLHESSNHDIDILLGLLVYIGWSNQQVYNNPNLTVFTQLAKAMVFALGINKPPSARKIMPLCVHSNAHEESSAPPVRTMEERRAVLGCFLISSVISSFLQEVDALRWTPQMDECMQVLDERQECLNDNILVQQVRFQLINEKINLGACWHKGSAETPEPLQAPPSFYLQAMQSQFQVVQSRMTPNSSRSKILLLHQYSTALGLNESALSKGSIVSPHLNFQQLECLCACVDSVASWFDVFLSIHPMEYIGFPFSIFSQLVHNLLTLYWLSTLDDRAWDRAAVRRTADVIAILNQVISNMAQVAPLTARGQDGDFADGDVFSRVSKMYDSVRIGWEAKLGPNPVVSRMADTNTQPVQEAVNNTIPVDLTLSFGEGDWLSDIFSTMTQ